MMVNVYSRQQARIFKHNTALRKTASRASVRVYSRRLNKIMDVDAVTFQRRSP